MHNKGKVLLGIGIFLVLVLFPIWYNAAQGGSGPMQKLVYGTEAKTCVADKAYMRESHMDLLDTWRDEVVRGTGEAFHKAPDGQMYEKSLTRTCLGCHTDKAQFCDRCHDYVGAEPYCWECHIVPGEK